VLKQKFLPNFAPHSNYSDMLLTYSEIISKSLTVKASFVLNTLKLLDDGASVPFIARYRKEMSGGMDEVQITEIKKQYEKLLDLSKRKITILKTLEELQLLTPDLEKTINECWDSITLEDIYLPYKPKRKTKASIARENGLEPLSKIIMTQVENDIEKRARQFLNNKIKNVNEALQGARDIIAEWINENQIARNNIRNLFQKEAFINSKVIKTKEEEASKYKNYFNTSELLDKCPSHRILAIRRGENEEFLRVSITVDEEKAIEKLERIFIKSNNSCTTQIKLAIKDCYKRLLQPSMETEFRQLSKEKADNEAIQVFAKNLRQLLLEPPLGQKRILAIDPGYKSGCKVVCLDAQGNLEHNQNIYAFGQEGNPKMAAKQIKTLVNSFKIDAIAIGNGTASRETEDLVRSIRFDKDIKAFVVSEDGASVYSASDIAREEFEKFDVTVRGAVSIGRRLMDPLAELVKIDPKSIGVGQYQHDVDQNKLKESLDRVTESCVNLVGVNLNTAGKHILTYISGLGPQLAQNIVNYRKEHGEFKSREELKKVPRMGEKAFEQCAGFLRIRGGTNPLDNSSVHPESYHIVEKMAKKIQVDIVYLIKSESLLSKINPSEFVDDSIGLPTLSDIIKELAKPGLDPRKQIKIFEFDKNIRKFEDLREGMILPGIITNITNFGAFVDIGVKQDGLVHISELADKFVSDPNEIVQLHQQVTVKVLSIDLERKRMGFSMKGLNPE